MRTLVFGPRGFLGANFVAHWRGIGSTVDISDRNLVSAELDRSRPDVVINCAGKTGRPNVDWCEYHRAETLRSNVIGPHVLVEECLARNIYFVHRSSGCLYSGDNGGVGFSEEDAPNFHGSYYVCTKTCSEQALAEFPVLILRPRMIFDGSLHERNLLVKLSTYDRVLDERNSLKFVPDLLVVARQLIHLRATGVFNVVNPGTRSPFEIMEEYRRVVLPSHAFVKLPARDLNHVASTGRSNCVLSIAKLHRIGIQIGDIGHALSLALESIRSQRTGQSRSPQKHFAH